MNTPIRRMKDLPQAHLLGAGTAMCAGCGGLEARQAGSLDPARLRVHQRRPVERADRRERGMRDAPHRDSETPRFADAALPV